GPAIAEEDFDRCAFFELRQLDVFKGRRLRRTRLRGHRGRDEVRNHEQEKIPPHETNLPCCRHQEWKAAIPSSNRRRSLPRALVFAAPWRRRHREWKAA